VDKMPFTALEARSMAKGGLPVNGPM
jgi:hypothetical protein